jgi:5-methylcytosine-specific restriction protein A
MPTSPKTFNQAKQKQRREKARGTAAQRGYDSHWARISRQHRAQYPVCQYCNNAAAVDVDHVRPFNGPNDPLRTDRANLRSTCRPCHRAKTARQ